MEWLPTPVFLSGEFHGIQRSLVGYSPWDHSDQHLKGNLKPNLYSIYYRMIKA